MWFVLRAISSERLIVCCNSDDIRHRRVRVCGFLVPGVRVSRGAFEHHDHISHNMHPRQYAVLCRNVFHYVCY